MITTYSSAFHFLSARTTVADQMMWVDEFKYPPQFKIGFLSSNPPMYDLIPKAKEGIDKLQQGGKYPRPQ